MGSFPRGFFAIALALMVMLFLILQLVTIDYGTRINDTPHILTAGVDADVVRSSGLTRDILVSEAPESREGPGLWALRFKLYSVEADEVVNIIALARINPREGRFDPGFYQYGGAYLYPLGLWFYAGQRAGFLEFRTLDDLLQDPQRMDRIWVFGRVFVLLSVVASAVLLGLALRRITNPTIALLLTAIYLACPASVMFSHTIKPHWYALLWVNGALLALVSGVADRRLSSTHEVSLGVMLGLAVGSATTFGLFAILVWLAIAVMTRRGIAQPAALLRVPLVAVIVFAASNPYYLANWQGLLLERAEAMGWMRPSLSTEAVVLFAVNSAVPGLGVALATVLAVAVLGRMVRPPAPGARLMAIAVVAPVVAIAIVTAGMAKWHVNFRYSAYVLPIGLLFLGAYAWPGRALTLTVVLLATMAQTLPLKLAFIDENDPAHSTRLRAATWIDANIRPGETLCLNSMKPAPYEVPPFQFDDYLIVRRECRWRVAVERETDYAATPPGFALVTRFRPRLSPERFPLVFGHINPQISIYRRES